MDNEEITVSGIIFNHGTNGRYEFYAHADHHNVLWQVWRHLGKPDQTGWYASVHQPGPGGVDGILNSFIHQESSALVGSQTDTGGDPEPSVLLCGLAGLISLGELPQYESYQMRVIAPVVGNKEANAASR
ncbi:MAG TPA: hypothetical protein VJ464_11000 [Blastocatellia bacterium]|nr:hypothetical protein [Blastocatellia bacterium]